MATTCSAPVLPLALPRFRCHNRHSPVISFDLARSITTVSTKTNLQDRSPVQQSPMAGQRAGVPSPSPSPVLAKQSPSNHPDSAKKACLCSPSNHPGAFRCSLHKNRPTSSASQLHVRRSAMKNSLVRVGSVEGGECMKRVLSALIRPSSHQFPRRRSFHPQPSRLRHMTKAIS